jgi:Flp pilus assembly pilin Flp
VIARPECRWPRHCSSTARNVNRRRAPNYQPGELMKNLIARFISDDQGQDLIEYVLIASVVSVGALVGASALGVSLNGWYNEGSVWVDGQSFP